MANIIQNVVRGAVSNTTRRLLAQSIRAQSTSTIGTCSNIYSTGSGEMTSTMSYERKDFSTAIETDYDYQPLFSLQSFINNSHSTAVQVEKSQIQALGIDLELSQVPAAMREFSFDKVLLVVGHGEVAKISDEDEATMDENEALSPQNAHKTQDRKELGMHRKLQREIVLI